MSKKNLHLIAMLVLGATTWFALGLQQFLLIEATPGNGMTPLQAVARFLIFFTILSNMLVATCLTAVLLDKDSVFSKPFFVTAIAVNIFIVGLVYNTILRQLWKPAGAQLLADNLLHVVVPSLFTIYWIVFARKDSLKWKYSFSWLIFPLVYLVYAMIRGGLEGFYPYPFLDLHIHSYSRVFLNCAGLMMVFLAVGLLFIAAGRRLSRR